MENEQILDMNEICQELGCSSKNISRLIKKEGLPAIKVGHGYKALRSEIHAWLSSRIRKEGGK